MSGITLTGLDGGNPLGYFAALGVLEVLSDRGLPARLHWHESGQWRPILSGIDASIDEIVAWIDEDRIACASEPALALEYEGKRDLKPPPEVFRAYLQALVSTCSPANRRGVDWASAFGTDVAVDNNGNTKPSALHFTAGQQQFLEMARRIGDGVTPDQTREAIVGPWLCVSPLPVMGWDATADRAYALRASNPSTDKKLGVPGADWLALRGLPCLPTVPVGSRVRTTGCIGKWKAGHFRWALWTQPLSRDMVRTLTRLDSVAMSSDERTARGIGVVFSCGIARSDQGGYGSFEPAAVM